MEYVPSSTCNHCFHDIISHRIVDGDFNYLLLYLPLLCSLKICVINTKSLLRGTAAQRLTINVTVVGSIPIRENAIFSFACSGKEAGRVVVFTLM